MSNETFRRVLRHHIVDTTSRSYYRAPVGRIPLLKLLIVAAAIGTLLVLYMP